MTAPHPSSPLPTEPQIARLVDAFYEKVRGDSVIGPVFEAAVEDWDSHLATLRDFWSSVMLTSGRYKGNPMAVHMRQPIEPAFFERWLELFGATAREQMAPELAARFILKAERIAESLKLGLFYRPARGPASPASPPTQG
jgi:hemoglobin